MKKSRKTLVLGVAAAVSGALATSAAQAQQLPRVNWKMQSAFGSNLPHLGPPGQRFEKDISDMTDGRFVIKFHEPGALVPTLQCFDAAAKGSVEACWTTPGFHQGKYPALGGQARGARCHRDSGSFLRKRRRHRHHGPG